MSDTAIHLLMILQAVLALFLLVCLLLPDLTGAVGGFLHNLTLGLFGKAAFFLPLLLLIGAYFLKKDICYHALSLKFCFGTLWMISVSVLFHTPVRGDIAFAHSSMWDRILAFYDGGVLHSGGGVIGGLCTALLGYAGLAGILLASIAGVIFMSMLYVGHTPRSLYITAMYHIYKQREIREEHRVARAPEEEARRALLEERRQELARMRADAAQRQTEERRLAEMRRMQMQPTHRRGAIDDNIYANDETAAFTEESSVPQTAAAEPVRKEKKPRRDGFRNDTDQGSDP